MKNNKCVKSIRQPTVRIAQAFSKGEDGAPDTPEVPANGFVEFEQGKDYDLDKIKFHHDAKQDKAVREGLRASDNFKQVQGSASPPADENKDKGAKDNAER